MSSMCRCISVAVFAAVASGDSIFSVDENGLVLLQSKVGKWQSLPEMNVVWSRPKALVDEMGKQADGLESRLNEVQQKSSALIAQQKAAYEQNMTNQRDGNKALQNQNDQLSRDISGLDKDSKHLREKNDNLRKANQKLVVDLEKMEANMSTVVEFLSDALNASEQDLDTAPELKVLADLSKLDNDHAEESEHLGKLNEVLVANGQDGMSLLEIGQAVNAHPQHEKHEKKAGFSELIEMVNLALSELTVETNASEWALHDEFEKKFGIGAAHKASLLSKQAELNATKADAIVLIDRMTAAMDHLENTHQYLLDKAEAARSFNKQLSSRPVPGKNGGAVSLLQIASQKLTLPDMKQVLQKPTTAYNTVNTHLVDLAAQLQQVQDKGVSEAEDASEQYNRQIKEIKINITHQEHENHKVVVDINKFDVSIAGLRENADVFTASNKKLRDDLQLIQANITLVQEFLIQSLDRANESTTDTPELLILSELENEDNTKKQELAHKKSLERITKKHEKLALLQLARPGAVKTKTNKTAGAQNILTELAGSLEKLMAEQAESEAALKEAFETEYEELSKTSETLVEEWDTLNTTRASKIEVETRLKLAVKHLEKTSKSLRKRREALLAFGHKLADREDPLAKAAAKPATEDTKAKKEMSLLESVFGLGEGKPTAKTETTESMVAKKTEKKAEKKTEKKHSKEKDAKDDEEKTKKNSKHSKKEKTHHKVKETDATDATVTEADANGTDEESSDDWEPLAWARSHLR